MIEVGFVEGQKVSTDVVDHYVLVLNTYLECGFGRFLGRRGTSRGDDEEGRERYASHRGRRTVTGENKMRGTRESALREM